ncbi:MAG: hypothetical protein LBS46_01200 [Dysgonamonadaceae bacterium]|nr:hypothetical protein [Dysgonamonadaceae bacterium]
MESSPRKPKCEGCPL